MRPCFRPALAIFLLLVVSVPAWAGPPAAIPDASQSRARQALQSFAKTWMQKMKKVERRNQRSPEAQGAGQVGYRGYDTDVRTELKPTGHPSAPYVGIIRYTENFYSCSDASAKDCSVAYTTPVTEIFRFQDGRWVY